MLTRIADVAVRRSRWILIGAALVALACLAVGASAPLFLKSGGFAAPDAESTRAADYLDAHFPGAAPTVVLLVSAPDGVDTPAAAAVAAGIDEKLRARGDVDGIQSYWTAPADLRQVLRSADGRAALVVAHAIGDDTEATEVAGAVAEQVEGDYGGVTVRAGGEATALFEMSQQTVRDLMVIESIAIPLAAIALILVFGSIVASLLPLIVGIFTIFAALAALRLLAAVGDISIFALNMTTALGFAVAIDSSLFMVSRFREELDGGAEVPDAVRRTVRTAGRTVLYSGLTVGLSLAALLVFPMYFLRSFAYAGLAVLGAAVLTTLFVVPAALALMGARVNTWDVRKALRRALGRAEPRVVALEQGRWYRFARWVMGRPVLATVGVVLVLLVLGVPFLSVKFGLADDRVLAAGSSRVVGDALRADFPADLTTGIAIVLPDQRVDPAALDTYAVALSRVPGVTSVLAGTGGYVGGLRAVAPQPALLTDTAAYLRVGTRVDPYAPEGTAQLDRLRAVAPPGPVLFGGPAASNADSVRALGARVPLALALVAVSMFAVLYLFTRSVVLPIKGLVLTALSLSATFGALVWIFQDGHLSGLLGFTPSGHLVPTMPILMFCLAFGVSMDYEVFLLSRIREEWLRSGDADGAVAVGIARTARIFTAAAAIMAIAFVGMVFSRVSFVQLFGLGLTLAVLADATIIRSVLVPAVMRLMGHLNWWTPIPGHARRPAPDAEPVAADRAEVPA